MYSPVSLLGSIAKDKDKELTFFENGESPANPLKKTLPFSQTLLTL